MKKLLLVFLLPFTAFAQSPAYVSVVYDVSNNVVFPRATMNLITNNPAIQSLSTDVYGIAGSLQELRRDFDEGMGGIGGSVQEGFESVSNRISDVETSFAEQIGNTQVSFSNSLDEAVSNLSGRISTAQSDTSAHFEEVSANVSSNANDIAVLQEISENNTRVSSTNAMLIARSLVSILDLQNAVSSNAVKIASNADTIGTNAAAIVEIRLQLDDLRGLISGITPAIETPDGKKWKAVGTYTESGTPTHAWVEYNGEQYGTILLDMPDNKHYKMVGVYTGAMTNKVTHAWEEIIYE